MTGTQILAGVVIAIAIVVGVSAVFMLDTTGKSGSGLGDEYTFDIEHLAKVDPNLIIYEESEPQINTSLQNSKAIAVDSAGTIYVAGDSLIRIISNVAALPRTIKLNGKPTSLAVAEDGKIYVCLGDHVEIYDGAGEKLGGWTGLGEKALLNSIAVYEDNVFVADAGNRIVIRYDRDGKIVNRIGEKDAERNIPGFIIPSPYFDLAVGRDGLLRVVNPGRHRIEAYTFDGDLEVYWGHFSNTDVKGFCGCCNPVNFAILEDESFVTCEKGLTRVKIYDPDGAFVGIAAGTEQLVAGGAAQICELPVNCQTGGFDVAVDKDGRILVLDTARNVIRTFTRKQQL